MELEPGSELELAYRLRGIVRELTPMGLEKASAAWLKTWPYAWRRAKTVAMEAEAEARVSARPWAEVWTRAQAKAWATAWAEAQARTVAVAQRRGWPRGWVGGNARAMVKAEAEALVVAGAWAWERARGESVPAALADWSTTIWYILTCLHRHGLARKLWHKSPATRDEYWCIIHFITPIARLPIELLRQIFLIIIDDEASPPLVLMRVCKQWHAIVTSIWGSLKLGMTTPIDVVARTLERNQWRLDIVMDTNSVDTDFHDDDFIPSCGAFEAIFAAMEANSRWRSLVVKSFPAQVDLPEGVIKHCLQQCPNATMSRLTTFRIKSACKPSPLLDRLLHILGTGTMASSQLTMVEINSAIVISFLASAYPSIFHFVKVLSLNTPGMPNPVDLLPHLHQLETFTASHISFPIYHSDIDLPFVHTLRHLSLRAVSIQWMIGRTFHVLEDCTLIFPLHRHVLRTFSTALPNCKHLTFQGYPLEILGGVSAHKLSHLTVTCSGSSNGRGNQELVWLSHHVLGESRLAPKILHISIEATNQAWVNALVFMSNLEELVIHNAKPSSLSAKVFQSLVAQPVHESNLDATSTPVESVLPMCPSLRRFGLKYDRWLRPSEQFDLILVFGSIIRSRQHSNYSLERFSLWTRSDQNDPLELIERSEISIEGFKRLAKEIGIGEDFFGFHSHCVDVSNPEAFWGVLPRILQLPALWMEETNIFADCELWFR